MTPSQFEELASDFIEKEIPDLSSSRSKAISQVRSTIERIDSEVTNRASKLKAPKNALSGVEKSFSSKADDIAIDFSKNVDDRAIKKHIDQFNNTVSKLNNKLKTTGGNIEDIRGFRKLWDKSFDKSIRDINPSDIINKPNSTQIKWRMWVEGRDELNSKFFELAAKRGDDLMKQDLKNMSLGIRSVEAIATRGGLSKDVWRRHKRKFITAGLTALGFGVLN